ncbi:MAG: adenylate kinase [Planctomycetales bacterium]|nr:adenylate kinase [Planctomycetales bacterium]
MRQLPEADMLIVFIGPPGAGKGTQSKRLLQYLNIPHLSTGEMLRHAKRERSAVGQMVAECIDAGRLVPDSLVIGLVSEKLEEPAYSHGCLLDGFPRTVAQARAFDEFLGKSGRQLDVAIELAADEEILVQRMLKRAKVEGRDDDTPKTIHERMRVFRSETSPVLQYYRQRGVLASIDALGSPDEVFGRIQAVVDARQQSSCSRGATG